MLKYRLWWKRAEGGLHPLCDLGNGPVPWLPTREAVEEERRHLIERRAIMNKDDEWGIEAQEFPVEIIDRNDDNTVVLLEEEYGYRLWVWHTGMTANALQKFWSGLDTVEPYFFTPEGLPGQLVRVAASCTRGEIWDSDFKTIIMLPEGFWTGHIHMEEDSGLTFRQQNGVRIDVRHRGFVKP